MFNEQLKRVTSGYTILQPRVSNSLPAQHSSLYTKLHGNEPGTDPYTLAVSDVYQDLFQEGSFIGKGIYDVDAFEIVLANRFPENRILSHDLLEGSYARAGLCTDVQLYEDYPSAYITDMLRRHRWIRGDWQIASWTTPFVPGTEKKLIKNPLSALSRWKIFDNLRRSILPMAHIYLLAYGWLLSSNPIIWTAVIMSISFLPPLVNFIWQMFNRPSDVLFYQHLIYSFRGLKDGWIIQVIDTFCLPYTAYSNTDAIARTLWRVYFSKRKLLQWTPFNSNAYDERNIIGIFVRMWVSPFLAVAILIAIQFYFPLATIAAAPLIAAWLIAPFMVWYISRTGSLKPAQINAEESKYLRLLSRRIWLFFQNFVTANDNYLPPDNFQETPVERTAHRTSPTNIGLALLANVTAFDFGYIGIYQLLERTTQTLQSSQKLEKYKGHLYNWYDTQTLEPLHPRYVSTVDSGNLMGHLITLKQALLALPDEKIITATQFEGLLDTVNILLQKNEIVTLNNFKQKIEKSYPFHLENIFTLKAFLEDLEGNVTQIFLSQDFNNDDAESEPWTEQIFAQIKAMKHELFQFIPWLNMPNVPEKFTALVPDFALMPSVLQLSKIEQALLQNIFLCYNEKNTTEENLWLDTYREAITESSRRAKELMLRVAQLAQKCTDLADADYKFLYDSTQNLLSIGYNVDENRRDNSFYDLLASEARLASFTAIAMGKLPQANWFNLGRQLTNVGSLPILLSWSGSVFEYLMPLLVMPTYENTLLDQTYKAVVEKQIEYGRKKNIPWGISESGYSLLDAHLNWQYRAFGVPGIGFKRGLGEDLVVSPYSTIMCLMVAPQAAHDNLKIMEAAGFMGKYGFYEAIDYTTSRLQRKQTYNVIKSFMAHHQGMAFLSLSYLINEQPMQKRFTADLQVKSALLILQEKVPIITNFYSPTVHAGDVNITPGGESNMRVITNPNTQIPEVQLLSNGRYNVMVTSAGGGYSKWKDIALTRWRQDATCDDWGTFCFIKDLEHDSFWSIAHQPALKNAENYEAVFSQGRAEFRRKDFSLEIHTEIVVSPEDDIELRRVHISNRSRQTRTIQITSYAEVVLAPAAADESHPAFSNLFVQTALQKDKNAILCTRRPRSAKETTPVMFHILKVRNATINNVSYETNRVAFIGRGNTIHNPSVMNLGSLQNTEGAVLDPIVAIQYSIEIEPFETVIADLLYGAADNTEAAQLLIDKYQDNNFSNRVLELAWTHSQVILRQINASEHDAQLYARMASAIIFVNPALRTNPAVIIKNNRGQSGLWSSAISGDIPIVLLQIEDNSNILLVKQLLQAHNYWRLKGLAVDLVIWNEDHGGYRQELQNEIQNLVTPFQIAEPKDKQGAIFIKSADQISNEDRILFQTVARIIISDKLGTLEEQLNRANSIKTAIPYFSPARFYPSLESKIAPNKDLIFNNGFGGFTPDGKEYIVQTSAELRTPAPWVNVIANSGFGFVVSEGGQMYTWIENAHSFRLTPWNNDPVGDLRGEAFYIRDEESGRFWSPTALPCCGKNLYRARHGFGYSVFEHSEDGIESTMTVYTHIELPIKFIAIKLKNNSSRPRKISATGYVEWVLGDLREKNMMHIVSELDVHTGALLARNAYNTALDGKVAFFDADDINRSFTTDRTEFIGRNGTMANPEAMNKARLSGRKGAALDPCAALQVTIDIVEEEEKEIIFRLGAAANIDEALKLVQQFEGSYAAKQALEEVHNYWNSTLSILQIETPDAATNLIANGWLTYQTLACRVWARSGFYQSGGAFGYRDQLQDVMALLYAQPVLARKHILLCASRQFREGDVQHWWHPPAGRGVRTTCSDDYLWLPFVTLKYLAITGDKGILNEHIHYLEGRLLNEGEESSYDLPIRSDAADSLYMHCVTAIKHSLTFGEHGLPFIGSGDWNDGMDKVGAEGKGESIWLAWLMYDILTDFAKVADEKADNGFAVLCTSQAETLKENINKNGWDGEWYRRAYFDDGTPLGSSQNEECKIDSIAQSWSVISGGGNAAYSQKAMQSAYEKLVRKDIGIIQLFDPPFDKSDVNPGYIKGYVPGVRENGGQYTHAAIWLVMAYAKLGQRERTWELLSMINPINRANSEENVARYKVEPYVIAADVYAQPLHQGRGGWTWYTGSAGWMYQLIIESFVGMKKMGDSLHFTPTMPADWKEVKVNYRFLDTNYKIVLLQTGKKEIIQNGIVKDKIELINSGETVHVTVEW